MGDGGRYVREQKGSKSHPVSMITSPSSLIFLRSLSLSFSPYIPIFFFSALALSHSCPLLPFSFPFLFYGSAAFFNSTLYLVLYLFHLDCWDCFFCVG
ncbi:hypothetical protein CROQUDRAFT_383593 [Cronartium quercuum f. sp. fusiforme G11]|uniref:Transmembrane protein n=1 Tax=Cronartium quercuum f. sp. fusiforme G11 TaxID=708437 RepID=A0A9P6T670_9BASI|nr:hypothetical protein CROQUDRAFT_383593 [Cronartium quercuum f. sp. fusiforme G11]